jgi:hypothetical protein
MGIRRGECQINTLNLQQIFCHDSLPSLLSYDLSITLKLRAAAQVRTRISDEIHFLLCQSCFWCASYFNYSEGVTSCPTCESNSIESLPISNSEFYTFNHDMNHGVTLEFSENREVS